MEKFKKVVMITTITATVLTALYLILTLFGVKFPEDYTAPILFTLGGLAVGGFFAINSLNIISKNKTLGWISFSLIAISVLLIDIMSWASLNFLLNITLSFSLLSVVFNVIVSLSLELGKKYLPVQIILYILTLILDLIATFKIFNAIPKGNGSGTTWFLVLLIVDIVGLVVLKILSKRQISQANSNMITITKEEYETLKEKAKKYDELNNK